jgi:SAM-dependent methyltransferase
MAIGVLHHLPDPLQGFERLARCLTPGGSMIVGLYSAKRKTSNAVIENWFDRLGAQTRHYFAREELEDWLNHIGAAAGTIVPTEDFGWTLVATLGSEERAKP